MLKPMDQDDFGTLLRRHCERAGISLRDLSARIDVSHATTGHWSRGERCPPPERTEQIIGVLRLNGEEAEAFRLAAAVAHVPSGLREEVSDLRAWKHMALEILAHIDGQLPPLASDRAATHTELVTRITTLRLANRALLDQLAGGAAPAAAAVAKRKRKAG